MQVCIVYDCLFPYTIGGAERWYRNLAEALAARGHDVTLLTLRQWESDDEPVIPGVRIVTAGPRMGLYTAQGRRRLLPPLVFGAGVLWHLLRRGRRYDVVHTASFPYFSLLAAALARRLGGYRIVVDWHEVWTAGYWREYLGRLGGAVGWRVQRACLRVPQRAFCFSRLHERRLHEQGLRGTLTRLEGQYDGPARPGRSPSLPTPSRSTPAVTSRRSRCRRSSRRWRSRGSRSRRFEARSTATAPSAGASRPRSGELGLEDAVSAPGFVNGETLERALATAMCFVLPSRREGYGRVVIEASARGVPVVVVDGPDNAATELVEEGVNGTIAADPQRPTISRPRSCASHEAGPALRESTRRLVPPERRAAFAGELAGDRARGLRRRGECELVAPQRRRAVAAHVKRRRSLEPGGAEAVGSVSGR